MDYSEKLKDPRWQRLRLEIFERDGFRCRLCHHDKHTLHIHHIEYAAGVEPWNSERTDLLTLCAHCHGNVVHCKTASQRKSFNVMLMGANLIGRMFANNYDFCDDEISTWYYRRNNGATDISGYITGMYRNDSNAASVDDAPWREK